MMVSEYSSSQRFCYVKTGWYTLSRLLLIHDLSGLVIAVFSIKLLKLELKINS